MIDSIFRSKEREICMLTSRDESQKKKRNLYATKESSEEVNKYVHPERQTDIVNFALQSLYGWCLCIFLQ